MASACVRYALFRDGRCTPPVEARGKPAPADRGFSPVAFISLVWCRTNPAYLVAEMKFSCKMGIVVVNVHAFVVTRATGALLSTINISFNQKARVACPDHHDGAGR